MAAVEIEKPAAKGYRPASAVDVGALYGANFAVLDGEKGLLQGQEVALDSVQQVRYLPGDLILFAEDPNWSLFVDLNLVLYGYSILLNQQI